jgi:hypothetical protein
MLVCGQHFTDEVIRKINLSQRALDELFPLEFANGWIGEAPMANLKR